MQGWGENNSPPAPFWLGPGGSWPSPVFWAGFGPEDNVFFFSLGRDRPNPFWAESAQKFWAESGPVGWAGPAMSSGPGLAQKSLFGPRSAQSILGRNRPTNFRAESGPVVWAGPARFNIIIYIYIYYILYYLYIYIYMKKKIIKICKNYRKIYMILL